MALNLHRDTKTDRGFYTTKWTKIALAKGVEAGSKEALEELCEAYYRPVETYVRSRVRDGSQVKDLVQDFFSDFLSRQSFHRVDRSKGRFRSYLLGAVNHFLLDHFKAMARQKRGGDMDIVSLDASTMQGEANSMEISDPKTIDPDLAFDREWAFTILDRALKALQAEESNKGREKPFEILKPWLTGAQGGQAQDETANALGLTVNAAKVAIHRLRKRFREHVQLEISQTVVHPSNIQEELQYLKQVISG